MPAANRPPFVVSLAAEFDHQHVLFGFFAISGRAAMPRMMFVSTGGRRHRGCKDGKALEAPAGEPALQTGRRFSKMTAGKPELGAPHSSMRSTSENPSLL